MYVTFRCYVNDRGYFTSNEILVWTVDKGEGAVRPGCNKAAEGTEARYTENTVLQSKGIPFLCMYTAERACVISLCCGSANAQPVCTIPDHKHGARNTCLYGRIFIQILRRTKDEDTQRCQHSLHAGCPNDHLPLLTRNTQNNLRKNNLRRISSRQAASSIPQCSQYMPSCFPSWYKINNM